MALSTCTPSETARFEQAFSIASLRSTYEGILESRRDAFTGEVSIPRGWDRQSQRQFERQLDQHLSAIQRKVVSSRYTFRPFVYVEVPKVTGGTRQIAMSTIRDRIVQGAMLPLVEAAVEGLLLPCCHAYRRGHSVHSAIQFIHRELCEEKTQFVFESDFSCFFDTLDQQRLIHLIDELPVDPRLQQLLFRYLRTPQMRKRAPPYPLSRTREAGVPQGGVLSGVLANLYLAAFDSALVHEGFQLVRYADDFVILAQDEVQAHAARERVDRLADALRLRLHPDKTAVRAVNRGFDFVGFRLRGTRVSIRPANVRKFLARIDGLLWDIHAPPPGTMWPPGLTRRKRRAIRHVNAKIQGAMLGGKPRSWIAFFALANDTAQIREVNRSIWQRVSRWHKVTSGTPLKHHELREWGLRSLTTEYHRVRRLLRTRRLRDLGLVSASGGS